MQDALNPWTQEADVVVVGFGAAGACAALQAHESGADVLVLDRFHGGGTTSKSGGVYYAGGGTATQKDAQITDTVDDMFEYLKLETKGIVQDETLRRFCEQSVANTEWLTGHGVPFEGSLCPVKTSYPSDKYYLYYSGNESFPPYTDVAKPAPRGHRAKAKGLPGAAFYDPLRASAERTGVRVSYESKVTELITDADGRVVGVAYTALPQGSAHAQLHEKLNQRAYNLKNYMPAKSKQLWKQCDKILEEHGVAQRVRAKNGVILAAGGFVYNRAMVKEHAPNYRKGMPLGTWGDQGEGIRLGMSVGGDTAHMDRVSAWRFINPPSAWATGFVVNQAGERYVNERLYGAAIGEAMVEHQDGRAYLVIDRAMFKKARSQVLWGRAHWFQAAPALLNMYFNAKKGRTIEEAAKAAKLPADAVRKTFDAYNAQAQSGADDPFGKDKENIVALTKPPFYIMDVSIDSQRFPCPTLTLGGLRVNEDTGAVKNHNDEDIPGLYAAGRNAVGICTQQYVSGLSIADCVFSGRRAGKSAATTSA